MASDRTTVRPSLRFGFGTRAAAATKIEIVLQRFVHNSVQAPDRCIASTMVVDGDATAHLSGEASVNPLGSSIAGR